MSYGDDEQVQPHFIATRVRLVGCIVATISYGAYYAVWSKMSVALRLRLRL
jgi:hypothetical protein